MNSAGYSLIELPIRAREKHYPLFKYILNLSIYYGLITVHHFHWQLISCLRCKWYHNRCFIQVIDNFGKKM